MKNGYPFVISTLHLPGRGRLYSAICRLCPFRYYFFSEADRKFSQLLLLLHKNLITNYNKFYNNG